MLSPAKPRVLVTRSRHQTSELASQLQSLGVEPILIPTIAIAPPESFAFLDEALTQLQTFQWLVFTSPNAVQAFAGRYGVARFSRPPKQNSTIPKIAAIGPATAQALNAIGRTPDLLPPQAVAESLAETLLAYVVPSQTRILLIRAEQARDVLPDTLRAAGADLTIAPAYRNILPQESIPLLHELFRTPDGWPDAITFTSSSTATNLFTLLETVNLTLPTDGVCGKTILRASIGPITSQTLRDLGYPPHLEAPEPNIITLAQTLSHHLHRQL